MTRRYRHQRIAATYAHAKRPPRQRLRPSRLQSGDPLYSAIWPPNDLSVEV